VLYSSSCAATSKAKADIARIRRILVAKRVAFDELDLADPVEGRVWRARMLAAHGPATTGITAGATTGATAAGSSFSAAALQVPQLHAGGAFVGGGDDVQELEDWGELDAALRGDLPRPQQQQQQEQQEQHGCR